MMLILNYFLPQGVANHLDDSFEEDEENLFSFNDTLDSSMVTIDKIINHSIIEEPETESSISF